MAAKLSLKEKLQSKHDEILKMLRDAGHDIATFQYHLDKGSIENIYWHHGYMEALADMIRLVEREEVMKAAEAERIVDTTNLEAPPALPSVRPRMKARKFPQPDDGDGSTGVKGAI